MFVEDMMNPYLKLMIQFEKRVPRTVLVCSRLDRLDYIQYRLRKARKKDERW
jgi:hypothetical protein